MDDDFARKAALVAHPHDEACSCTRCRGFEVGNQIAAKHGARSAVEIVAPARELAECITDVLISEGVWRDSFATTVGNYAVVLVRVQRATAALGEVDAASADNPLSPYLAATHEARLAALTALRGDLRSWLSLALKFETELGLTPLARARLGLDVARTRSTLDEYLARAYPGDGDA